MIETLNTKKIIARIEESTAQLDELNAFMKMLTEDSSRLNKTYEVEELMKINPTSILHTMPMVLNGVDMQARMERQIELAPPMISDDVDFV